MANLSIFELRRLPRRRLGRQDVDLLKLWLSIANDALDDDPDSDTLPLLLFEPHCDAHDKQVDRWWPGYHSWLCGFPLGSTAQPGLSRVVAAVTASSSAPAYEYLNDGLVSKRFKVDAPFNKSTWHSETRRQPRHADGRYSGQEWSALAAVPTENISCGLKRTLIGWDLSVLWSQRKIGLWRSTTFWARYDGLSWLRYVKWRTILRSRPFFDVTRHWYWHDVKCWTNTFTCNYTTRRLFETDGDETSTSTTSVVISVSSVASTIASTD